MHTRLVVALFASVLVSAPAGMMANAEATRAKGVKSQRPTTPVAHPKGKYCVKTGRFIPAASTK